MKSRINRLTALPLGLALVLALTLAGCPQLTGDDDPALTGTVAIGGTLLVGEVLTANISALDGEGTVSYQWQWGNTANGDFAAIADAAQASYTLAPADNGKYVRVEVSRAGYSGTKISAVRGPVSEGDGEVDMDALAAAVETAGTKKDVVTVAANASTVPYGTKWAAQTAIDTYGEAITTAQDVIDNSVSTQAEVDAALATLAAATTVFETACQDGLLFTGEDAIENLRAYLDSKVQNTKDNPYPVYLKVPIAELEADTYDSIAGMTRTDPLGYLLDNLTRFVDLDMSACTGDTLGDFNPDTTGSRYRPDRNYVVSVVLPSGLTTLGSYEFQLFQNLETVVLPGGLTQIGDSVFENCAVLATVNFPNSLTAIRSGAFRGTALVTVVLPDPPTPDHVLTVGSRIFAGCSNLVSVTFPASVKALVANMFRSGAYADPDAEPCPNLKTVILKRWNPDGSAIADKITTLPSTTASAVFAGTHADLKIYVPGVEAKDTYKSNSYWNSNWGAKLTYVGEGE
jgi:hypothetical protein